MSRRFDWARYVSLSDVRLITLRLLDSLTSILSSLFLSILTSNRFYERLTVTGCGLRFLVYLAWPAREAGRGSSNDVGCVGSGVVLSFRKLH